MEWEGSQSQSSSQRKSLVRSPSLSSASLPPPPSTTSIASRARGGSSSPPESLSAAARSHSHSSSKMLASTSSILSASPLELTGPRGAKSHRIMAGSTSPASAPQSYSLSGRQSPVVLISSTTSSPSPSTSPHSSSSSVAGRLQLDHHHRHLKHHHQHHHQPFHSQSFNRSSPPSNSTTTCVEADTDSCGAVDLVAPSRATRKVQDQPEELVVVTTPVSLSSPGSIGGQQKHNLKGVPFSSSYRASISPSTLFTRTTTLKDEELLRDEEAQDKEQNHPTDLSNPSKTNSTTTSQLHHKNRAELEEQSAGGSRAGADPNKQQSHQKHQVPLSIRKNKPIPPPLDLSIGAANLSLHHQINISAQTKPNHSFTPISNHSATQIIHNPPHQQPTSPLYLGSPKCADNKSLPLRKRYQWSPPTQMNGAEQGEAGAVGVATTTTAASSSSIMMPLYTESQHQLKTGLAGDVTTSGDNNNGTSNNRNDNIDNCNSSPGSAGIYNNRPWVLENMVPLSAPPITTSSRNHHHPHHITLASNTNTNNNSSGQLHTPTPFFTPNEPSPKFMNSPVFSYSNPDTSLYQGPFSPIRASSLYPPNSPFMHLNLNSPLPHLQSSSNSSSISSSSNSSNSSNLSNGSSSQSGSGSGMGNTCFNMIPSTLLSPAPSQASTNSLSYEDLHEKSLSLFTPIWSIFIPGTKVRFVGAMNSMDWYLVEFLAQSGDSLLGLKGEYAPHGLELRKLVMTSSPKERVQLTFCPVADPNHPQIEVNCDPGHPFMVDKKGWCAVKPEVFQETYGSHCQQLEGGDICLSLNAARSPNNNVISINNNNATYLQHQQQSMMHHSSGFTNSLHPQNVQGSNMINNNSIINTSGVALANMHNLSHLQNNSNMNSVNSIKMEAMDVKPIPISVLPQNNQIHMGMMQSPPPPQQLHNQHNHHNHQRSPGIANRKTCAVAMSAPGSPAKRAKDANKDGDQPAKGRRPMNAFLLFAKDKRPELIQKFPGKDNRTISVLLGEAWQKLAAPERERYVSNAKARAEEQKRIHPDCWKRKRSQSTSL